MRLTRFTDYSLRVLIYLGQNNQNRVTINQISESYDISKNHLMKVVSNLTRLKFVSAQRGPGGGIPAVRLAEMGHEVLVLEAGPEIGGPGAGEYLHSTEVDGELGLPFKGTVQLGGSSNLWGGRMAKLEPVDFAARDWVPMSGWPVTASKG